MRKAALQVLPANSATLAAITKVGLLNDANLNTRLAAVLKVADLPESPEAGKELQAEAVLSQNSEDRWISVALKVAIARHVKTADADAHAGHVMPAGDHKIQANPVRIRKLLMRVLPEKWIK